MSTPPLDPIYCRKCKKQMPSDQPLCGECGWDQSKPYDPREEKLRQEAQESAARQSDDERLRKERVAAAFESDPIHEIRESRSRVEGFLKSLTTQQIVGGATCLWGWLMMAHAWIWWDIGVRSNDPEGPSRVTNFGLMNDRLVYVIFGAALFIGGAILYSGDRKKE